MLSPISDLSPDPRPSDPPLEEAPTSPPTIRPSQLFETGSMVEVKGLGFGVVQWLGKMAGTPTAGVELVNTTHKHLTICSTLHSATQQESCDCNVYV